MCTAVVATLQSKNDSAKKENSLGIYCAFLAESVKDK